MGGPDMRDDKLMDALRSMVRKHGLSRVQQSLIELASSSCGLNAQQTDQSPRRERRESPSKKMNRVTASAYVDKMDIPLEKKEALSVLAKRFEDKSFLPTVADISNFCRVHRIALPRSRSRGSAIPRVFKFMAEMGASDIRKMVDGGMFSGPSRLAPIADAIRSRSRSPRPQDPLSATLISSPSFESTRPGGLSRGERLPES